MFSATCLLANFEFVGETDSQRASNATASCSIVFVQCTVLYRTSCEKWLVYSKYYVNAVCSMWDAVRSLSCSAARTGSAAPAARFSPERSAR